jgi:hypothetical protein
MFDVPGRHTFFLAVDSAFQVKTFPNVIFSFFDIFFTIPHFSGNLELFCSLCTTKLSVFAKETTVPYYIKLQNVMNCKNHKWAT